MKLLIDNCLSPELALRMAVLGHHALHVRDFGAGAASDDEVMRLAVEHDCVLVSADTDFGTLLAQLRTAKPSFVLVRTTNRRRAIGLASLLNGVLAMAEKELASGAIVTIRDDAFRVRSLPLW